MNTSTDQLDAIVIGAGPAGSTVAAVLAQRGRRVLVLEKDKFPRYKVGESLMPYCYYPLERIGVIDQVKNAGFVQKHSVQFVRTDGKLSAPFYFFQHLKHEAATTWQVDRAKFDMMLLENAKAKGAQVVEQVNVRELIKEGDTVVGVRARDAEGVDHEYRAPVTLDCSGRDMFGINQNDWRVNDPQLKKIAVWAYYEGAMRDEGLDEGSTTVAYIPDKGWFWYIPLANDRVSVGIVGERDYLYRGERNPEAIFEREVQENAWIKQHLAPGKRVTDFHVTGDYSYRSRKIATDGLVLVGDAYAFLDPVFSSGVFLALRGGELAADAVDAALSAGDVTADRFVEYGAQIRTGLEAMRKLVYAFYDDGFSFGKLIRKHPDVRPALTDCLIGNLFRDFDELFNAVGEFAQLPEPVHTDAA